ncbi:hypothetical protein PVA45_06710 [Entomospira entomophila]|uniref:Uncharacterized protein n=1 Tax=Entomospira entomophila TaxID=2719988 RepID=A0A968KU83_9SPIO|nr:hypothetical protein [Entomospira entomophilus]NIZ41191.1 hypothetical protein [Entomospira entomophilus]WDI35398.1 hypothetical protein PVA45_06710 [Entomospira entomophilus]
MKQAQENPIHSRITPQEKETIKNTNVKQETTVPPISTSETEAIAGAGIATGAIVAGASPLAAGLIAFGAVKGLNDITKL